MADIGLQARRCAARRTADFAYLEGGTSIDQPVYERWLYQFQLCVERDA